MFTFLDLKINDIIVTLFASIVTYEFTFFIQYSNLNNNEQTIRYPFKYVYYVILKLNLWSYQNCMQYAYNFIMF